MGTSPSTKETTLHHYRDPLAAQLWADPAIDFLGVVIQPTSDDYLHKRFTARCTATILGGMRPDGVLVCVDAWGNAHIDFAAVIEFVGEQGIPVVGLTFVGVQAAFVVTNPYMDAIVDLNKTSDGVENCVLGENTAIVDDAIKALAILKNRIRKKNPSRLLTGGPESGLVRQMRTLQVYSFPIEAVRAAGKTCIEATTLYVDVQQVEQKIFSWKGRGSHLLERISKVTVQILDPGNHAVFVNSILDVSPIAAKGEGRLGEGTTHVLHGVQVLLTAVDTAGLQPINGGAATGMLHEVMRLGRCGTPAQGEYLIHVDVQLKEGEAMTREGIMAAHLAADILVGEIRQSLRELNRYQAKERQRFIESTRPGLLRVALVKMTSGVSAMGDTAVFPAEPGGFIGSNSIMDLTHNLPVVLSPNEYRDGIVHSLS